MMNMALESHERRLAANRSKPPAPLTRTVPSNGTTVPSDGHDHQPNERKRPLTSVVTPDSRVAPELLVANDPSFNPARSYQPINAPPPPPQIGNSIPTFQPATPYGDGGASYRPGGSSQPGTPLAPTYQPNPFYPGAPSSATPQHPPYTQDWLAWSQQMMPAISLGANQTPAPAQPPQPPPPGPPDYVKYSSASTLVQLRVGDPGAAVGVAHMPDVWPMSFLGYPPEAQGRDL
jgi:hypothetical protein